MEEKSIIADQLKEINDRINRLEKTAEKQEEDGIYDSAVYEEIERLEDQRMELEIELSNL